MAERKPKIELTWKQCEMVASYYRFPTAVLLFNEDTMKKRLKGHRKDKVPMAELRKQLAEKEKENAALTARIAKAKELLNSNDPPKEFKWKIGAHLCPEWTDKEKAEWEVRRGRFVWAGKDGRKFIVKALEGK